MPALSVGNLTRLRTTRHTTALDMVVYVPPIIWSARVNGTQTQGDQTITVDGVITNYFTPAHAPAKNFLVGFSAVDVGGSELGTTLFKSYAAPTLSVGVHGVTLTDDLYITVWEVVPPAPIPYEVSASDVISEDGNVVYDAVTLRQNDLFDPLARCGTHALLYLDPDSGLATGKFYSRSVAVATGATLSTYAWTFRNGTPGTSAVAGTAGVPVEVTWDTVGDYYCSLTVTDSNGKTHTRWFVVFVRKEYEAAIANAIPYVPGGTGTLAYRQIVIDGAEADAEGGVYSASMRVYTTADTDKFPAGALVVIGSREWYGTEKVCIGNETWRENIKLVAYIKSDTVVRNLADGYVEFAIESVSGVMEELAVDEGELESKVAPAAWHEVKSLTYNLGAYHLLTQHSTISQVTDVYLNLPTYTIEFIDLAGDSLAEQIRNFIGAVRGQMGCSAQGHLYLEANPQLLPYADRSTTYVLDTTSADFREAIDFGEEQQRKAVRQLILNGDTWNGDVYFSMAPAKPYGSGKPEVVDGIRVDDQAEANTLSGVFLSYRNASYQDVSVQWRGNYPWDVFPREPFRMSVTAAQNRRGIVWTTVRCWTKRVSWSYAPPGILLVDTVIEKDATNEAGDGTDDGETNTNPPGTIPTPTTPVPTIPAPTLPQPWEAYDASGGYVGAFASEIAQAIGLPNAATWNHYFVTVTGAVAWTIELNGVEIASGTGTASGSLASPATFVGGSGVVFTIAGGGSDLFWGIGV